MAKNQNTVLSVNVNKLATLRNSRGKNNPDVVQSALDLIRLGAQGITVHPRPDGRHIRFSDVEALKSVIDVELNVEGYPSEDFLVLVAKVRPAQVTLVPDPPGVLTSNAGWDVGQTANLLKSVVARLKQIPTRVSVFVDPQTMNNEDWATLREINVDRVELYTERYAEKFATPEQDQVLRDYKSAAQMARNVGLGVNAGHDLNLDNLSSLIDEIPWMDEVSIGHALICDALYLGYPETIRRYLNCLEPSAAKEK